MVGTEKKSRVDLLSKIDVLLIDLYVPVIFYFVVVSTFGNLLCDLRRIETAALALIIFDPIQQQFVPNYFFLYALNFALSDNVLLSI